MFKIGSYVRIKNGFTVIYHLDNSYIGKLGKVVDAQPDDSIFKVDVIGKQISWFLIDDLMWLSPIERLSLEVDGIQSW